MWCIGVKHAGWWCVWGGEGRGGGQRFTWRRACNLVVACYSMCKTARLDSSLWPIPQQHVTQLHPALPTCSGGCATVVEQAERQVI
jgi:hypothetical protein